MRVTYEQALADHTYLWTEYGAANDMTGAYVDQDDLTRLLRSPTKATARDCLCDQIRYWFEAGPDSSSSFGRTMDSQDQMLHEIAERHGADFS